MSSGLLEAPAGDQLCVLLLGSKGGEEEEGVKRKEVGCQWESPQEERREVGCQSDVAERRDVSVQVDLLTQQLSWRHSGSSAVLLQCFAVRPDGQDGGALLQHCTPTKTRARPIQPAIKPQTPALPESRTRTQRKRRPPSWRVDLLSPEPHRPPSRNRRQHRASPETETRQVEEERQSDDPTWTLPESDAASPQSALAGDEEPGDSPSLHAVLCEVKMEPDSTVCDVCGKVMKNKSSLARHSFIHTGQKPYGCHLCELRFNRRDNLQHHLSRLHPGGVSRLERPRRVQTWLCHVCGKTFRCRSALKTHEVIHLGIKPHRCDLCPKAYMRANDLEHHRKAVHVDGGSAPQRSGSLLCDFCGKEFKFRSQLTVHFQTHTGERPHLCDVCGRKFCRQYQLERHKTLVHAGHVGGVESMSADSPFICGICGKRLKSEALLAAHSRVHSGERPYRCTVCHRGFVRASCLKEHHLRVHLKARGHEGPRRRKSTASSKSFPCPVCSKVFKFKSLLASHAVIHSEVRPHACDLCSRCFRRFSHLKRHREVVHANGERLPESFVCHICGKDKKCRSQLARHVLIHTGERPFTCDLCPARFNRRGNLQQHKKRMHGVGAADAQDETPVLFEDEVEMAPALTYKQEETVQAEEEPEATAGAETDAAELT